MMKRDKGRLWSEPFGAGYNVRGWGGGEVVFSERVRNNVKGVGYEYWHIWLHMTRVYMGPV